MNYQLKPILDEVASREWFYEFDLPDGNKTRSYLPESVRAVHDTRLRMLDSLIDQIYGDKSTLASKSALDFACHQAWFTSYLSKKGFKKVVGTDAREEHISDATLITQALGLENVTFVRADIDFIPHSKEAILQPAELVLMFGLLYHLENPVGAIRVAYNLCKEVCVFETQVGPHVSGMLDWGNYEFVRPMMGNFTVIDEVADNHTNEASTRGICLVPSTDTLLWLMEKIGFKNVGLVPVPPDGYEQLRHGKRVMAVGYR